MLLGALAALLAAVLLWTVHRPAAPVAGAPPAGTAPSPPPQEQLLTAVLDRIGVTRWSEALGWYEMQQAGLLDGEVTGDTPVWAGRSGQSRFHSVPVCGGMKSPVRRTLAEALEAGLLPCPACWDGAAPTPSGG